LEPKKDAGVELRGGVVCTRAQAKIYLLKFNFEALLRRAASYHYHSNVHPKLRFSLKLAQLLALLALLTCTIAAQDRAYATQAPFNRAPYRVGERLTYNVSFSHYASAAHLELSVDSQGMFFHRDGIQLRAHVETVGIVNVALLSINNDYTTYVDPGTGLPYRAHQLMRESGRTSEADRDYNQAAGTQSLGTFDLLSAIYRVRSLPLADGSAYYLTVQHQGDQYDAEIRILGRQMLTTSGGSYNTIVAKVNLRNSHDYSIRIYFSNDERHVPVLITAKAAESEIRAELAGEITGPTPVETSSPVQPIKTDPRDSPAQPTPKTSVSTQAQPPVVTADLPLRDLPFKIGEELTYRVFLGSSAEQVGTVTFNLKARGRYFNRDGLLIAVTAQTTGPGSRVFPVNDQINSYIDPITLLPFRTELNLSEGKYHYSRAYDLDQNRGAATTDAKERIEIPVGTHDLISAFYSVRTFDLWPPKQNAISIMATTLPRSLLVTSQRRETIEVGGQKIPAIMVTLALPTDDPQGDRLQVRLWIGDDGRRLPIRITAVTKLGPVRADLVIAPITLR
jgi:hypothetical protein